MDESRSQNDSFENDSRPEQPEETLLEQLKELGHKKQLQILDLCCGAGRNAIPLAKALRGSGSRIICVDSEEQAIESLRKNAKKSRVDDLIFPFCQNVHAYPITDKTYDYIISWSCLEHLKKQQDFEEMLPRIKKGTSPKGINCFLINTEVSEFDIAKNIERKALIGLNLKQDQLIKSLRENYKNWQILKLEQENFINNLERYGRKIIFKSRPLIFCARKSA